MKISKICWVKNTIRIPLKQSWHVSAKKSVLKLRNMKIPLHNVANVKEGPTMALLKNNIKLKTESLNERGRRLTYQYLFKQPLTSKFSRKGLVPRKTTNSDFTLGQIPKKSTQKFNIRCECNKRVPVKYSYILKKNIFLSKKTQSIHTQNKSRKQKIGMNAIVTDTNEDPRVEGLLPALPKMNVSDKTSCKIEFKPEKEKEIKELPTLETPSESVKVLNVIHKVLKEKLPEKEINEIYVNTKWPNNYSQKKSSIELTKNLEVIKPKILMKHNGTSTTFLHKKKINYRDLVQIKVFKGRSGAFYLDGIKYNIRANQLANNKLVMFNETNTLKDITNYKKNDNGVYKWMGYTNSVEDSTLNTTFNKNLDQVWVHFDKHKVKTMETIRKHSLIFKKHSLILVPMIFITMAFIEFLLEIAL